MRRKPNILLDIEDLMERWGVRKTTANRWVAKDGFPAPAAVFRRWGRTWRRTAVDKWEADCAKELARSKVR